MIFNRVRHIIGCNGRSGAGESVRMRGVNLAALTWANRSRGTLTPRAASLIRWLEALEMAFGVLSQCIGDVLADHI